MRENGSRDELETFLSAHDEVLFDVSTRLYEARRDFLRDGFEGYATDTIYCRDSGTYKYWPVKDGSYFVGYDEPCPGEQEIIDEFTTDTNFEYLGCGNARLVFAAPERDFAVKIGRCGPDLNFGHGRKHILSEREYTRKYAADAPILPCLHSSSRGEFGVYPLIEADMSEQPPEDDSVIGRLQERVESAIPKRDRHRVSVHSPNFGWWNGEPKVIDYFHARRNSPMGVPDHVDGELVIEEVDRLRREGEKMDLAEDGRTLVEPDVAGD